MIVAPTETIRDAGWLKLDLLANGVELDASVLCAEHTEHSFAARRNFYNNPIWETAEAPLPQEFKVCGLVVGLNSYGSSPWRLTWNSDAASYALQRVDIGLRIHPQLINDLAAFRNSPRLAQLANLYGGAALAFFSPRSCYFFQDGSQCGFCSLAGTAAEAKEFKNALSAGDVRDAVRAVLLSDSQRIEQIMIVGGNMRDLDRGFKHHVALASAAATELARSKQGAAVSIHVATMPPRDLNLIESLRGFPNIHVMFNLEVWDPARFAEVCPGKAKDYGRNAMLRALERLRETIGAYRAHTLLVTGLEPAAVTLKGARTLATMGISPIINIYHSDRHSRFGLGRRPSFAQLSEVARGLQDLYTEFPLMPYWRRCGRNSIDAEAQRGLYGHPVPDFLERN